MITITKLEKQKKSNGRWNIYADGEFCFGLYDDTILKFDVHVNSSFSESELENIREYDEYIYGKNVAYNYLSYRIRSVSELKKKLKEKKISEKSITKVLEILEEQKLTNDDEFARALISDKLKKKPVGRKILRQKLFEKGVPKQVGEEAISKLVTDDDEYRLAEESIIKYLNKLAGLENIQKRKKAFDHLARRGFEFGTITELINKILKAD